MLYYIFSSTLSGTVNLRPYRLSVRTRPFQGCKRGSIPRRVMRAKSAKADFCVDMNLREIVWDTISSKSNRFGGHGRTSDCRQTGA